MNVLERASFGQLKRKPGNVFNPAQRTGRLAG
jgi:hypothetical protein